MKVGYAHTLGPNDDLTSQADELRRAGCERTFADTVGNFRQEHPGLKAALDYVQAGDTLVVCRLDRLGRSLKELVEIVCALDEKGVLFQSLQDAIDTATNDGRLVLHIFGALAAFERNVGRARTQVGLKAARARGREGGRPQALDDAGREQLYQLYDSGQHTIKELCQTFAISKSTLYSYLRKRHRSAWVDAAG